MPLQLQEYHLYYEHRLEWMWRSSALDTKTKHILSFISEKSILNVSKAKTLQRLKEFKSEL